MCFSLSVRTTNDGTSTSCFPAAKAMDAGLEKVGRGSRGIACVYTLSGRTEELSGAAPVGAWLPGIGANRRSRASMRLGNHGILIQMPREATAGSPEKCASAGSGDLIFIATPPAEKASRGGSIFHSDPFHLLSDSLLATVSWTAGRPASQFLKINKES